GTAVQLTAATFAARTAFTADSCRWVTAEIARALGYQLSANVTPEPAGPSSPGAMTQTVQPKPVMQTSPERPMPAHPAGNRTRAWLLVAPVAIVAVVAAGIFATSRHNRSASAGVPAPRLASFVSASEQVLRVRRLTLVSGYEPEIAVTTTAGQPSA